MLVPEKKKKASLIKLAAFSKESLRAQSFAFGATFAGKRYMRVENTLCLLAEINSAPL